MGYLAVGGSSSREAVMSTHKTLASSRASFTASTVSSGLISPTEISFITNHYRQVHPCIKSVFRNIDCLDTVLLPFVARFDVSHQKCRSKMSASQFLADHISTIKSSLARSGDIGLTTGHRIAFRKGHDCFPSLLSIYPL